MNLKNGATALKTVSQGMEKMVQKICSKTSTGKTGKGRRLKIFLQVVWLTGIIGKLWSEIMVKIGALKIDF